MIVTDSLAMEGVRTLFDDDRVPVEAILAGADQMLMPPDLVVAIGGVREAVASGEITEERLDQSVRRILAQKLRRGLFEDVQVDAARAAGYGLSNSYISQFLTAENLLYPGGEIQNGSKSLTVSTDAKFQSVEDVANMLITLPTGGMVRLGEVADVSLQAQDADTFVYVDFIFDAGTALRRPLLVFAVMVASNVQQGHGAEGHKKAEIFRIQVAAGDDQVNIL